MAKTTASLASVTEFYNSIPDDGVRDDCRAIARVMSQATKANAKMWGANIVGFGTYRCTYANGQEAEWMITAFSPRQKNITLYISPGFEGREALLEKLGPHSCGKSCVYIKRLSDVHMPTLKKLVAASVRHVRRTTSAR
jgi:hypothetical protein